MTSSSLVGQFDLETDRSPLGNDAADADERWWVRCAGAAVVGVVVGLAYLVVMPGLPGLVQTAWCLRPGVPDCDPGSQTTGQLVTVVIWTVVLAVTATAVTALLGPLVSAVGRVRLTLPLVLLGPPTLWAVVVLGEPLGVSLQAMRSPAIVVQAALAYLLLGALGAVKVRPHWRWLAAAGVLVATAVVIASGYPFG
ncbi:MAG TPA: hypothetical protein VHF06_11725 [Pseudonocardiaceae bacterium]|nr:hypothetical protein [Pseudonocardiaceae bacterium]